MENNYHFHLSNLNIKDQFAFSGDFEKVQDSDEFKKEITEMTQDILLRKTLPSLNKDLQDKVITEIDYRIDSVGHVKIAVTTAEGDVKEYEVIEPQQKLLSLINQLGIRVLAQQAAPQIKPPLVKAPDYFANLESPTKESVPFLRSLLNYIGKLLTFNWHVKEPVTAIITKKIQKLTPDELKSLYCKPLELYQEIEDAVFQNVGYQFMTRDEMVDCVNEILVELVNKKLESQKLPKWSEKTLYDLNVARFMQKAIEGRIPWDQFERKLNSIAPHMIPIKRLAQIPVNAQNRDTLVTVWKHLLGNLFMKGHLDQLLDEKNVKGLVTQLKYGEQYAIARKLMPSEIKADLSKFTNDLDSLKKIEDVVDWKSQEKVYVEYIYPKMNEKIEELIGTTHYWNIAHALRSKKIRDEMVESILREAKEGIMKAKGSTPALIAMFDPEFVHNKLIQELENRANFDGYFTSKQLENLRNYRSAEVMGHDFEMKLKMEIESFHSAVNHAHKDYDILLKKLETLHQEDPVIARKMKLIDEIKEKEIELSDVELPVFFTENEFEKARLEIGSKRGELIEKEQEYYRAKGYPKAGEQVPELELIAKQLSWLEGLEKKLNSVGDKIAKANEAYEKITGHKPLLIGKHNLLLNSDKIKEIEAKIDNFLELYEKFSKAELKEQPETQQKCLDALLEMAKQKKGALSSFIYGDIDKLGWSILDGRRNALIKQMEEFRALGVLSTQQTELKEKVQKELASLDPVFAPRREIDKISHDLEVLNKGYHKEVKMVKGEIDVKLKSIKEKFKNSFNKGLEQVISLHAFKIYPFQLDAIYHITPSEIKDSEVEFYRFLWKGTFEILFKDSQCASLDAIAPLGDKERKALDPYIRAKYEFLQYKSIPEILKKAISTDLDGFESKITNQDAKKYIDHEIQIEPEYVDEIIFDEAVLKDIMVDATKHPLLNPGEKCDLMRLTKILDKAIPLKLKDESKQKLIRMIDAQTLYPFHDEEKNKLKRMINSEVANHLDNDEKERLKEIITKTVMSNPKDILADGERKEILDLIDEKSLHIVSDEEKQSVKDMIEMTVENPYFRKRLKILEGEKETFNIEGYLQFFPSFTHNLIRKYFGEKDEFEGVKKEKLPLGIDDKAIKMLSMISAKLPKLNEYQKVIEKTEILLNSLLAAQPGAKLPEEEKLTLKEMATLTNLVRGDVREKNTLDLILALDLGEEGTDLGRLKKLSLKGEALLEKIEEEIRPKMLAYYDDGDLLGYAGAKKTAWLGQLKGEEYFTYLLTGLTHGAKLYKDKGGPEGKENRLMISHVEGKWYQKEISLYQILISNIYGLDVTPLFDPDTQQVLQKIYGTNWKEQVNKKFQEIERGIHSNIDKHFKRIENNAVTRTKAGLADYATFLKPFAPDKIEGHYGEHPQDFNEIHKKFFEGKDIDEEQICSEFATQSTLAAMIEMNRFLAEEIITKSFGFNTLDQYKARIHRGLRSGAEFTANENDYLNGIRYYGTDANITAAAEAKLRRILKSQGLSKSDINLFIRLENREIFDLPYEKTLKMSTVHPGMMVKLLENKKCVKKKELPPEIARFIQVPQNVK